MQTVEAQYGGYNRWRRDIYRVQLTFKFFVLAVVPADTKLCNADQVQDSAVKRRQFTRASSLARHHSDDRMCRQTDTLLRHTLVW